MQTPWQDKLRQIDPYVPGEQSRDPDVIKLNANENPYPPSPAVTEVLRNFNPARLRLYPDANSHVLKSALAARFGLKESQIFVGNGSDDVLALCFQAFFCSDKPILFPDVTYSFYPVWCSLFRIPYRTVPLDADFALRPEDYQNAGGVILPNPNAPTGRLESRETVIRLLENNPDCIVIIDEAYIDFGGTSCVDLLPQFGNLVVVQTMSKSRSLAGLRVGYAMASSALIDVLEAVKNSYNSYTMDMVTLEAAAASVRDEAYFSATCAKVVATRERVTDALREMGFTVLPSMTNFVLATHPKHQAQALFEALKTRKIFVRYFKLPRVDNHLRITIGTDAEVDALLDALREILEE